MNQIPIEYIRKTINVNGKKEIIKNSFYLQKSPNLQSLLNKTDSGDITFNERLGHIAYKILAKNNLPLIDPKIALKKIIDGFIEIQEIDSKEDRLYRTGKLFLELGYSDFITRDIDLITQKNEVTRYQILKIIVEKYKGARADFLEKINKTETWGKKGTLPLIYFFKKNVGFTGGNLEEMAEIYEHFVPSNTDWRKDIKLPNRDELQNNDVQYILGYIFGNNSGLFDRKGIESKTGITVYFKSEEKAEKIRNLINEVFNYKAKIKKKINQKKEPTILGRSIPLLKNSCVILQITSKAITSFLEMDLGIYKKNYEEWDQWERKKHFVRGVIDSRGRNTAKNEHIMNFRRDLELLKKVKDVLNSNKIKYSYYDKEKKIYIGKTALKKLED